MRNMKREGNQKPQMHQEMLKIVLEEETNCLCQKMLRDPKGKKIRKDH